MYKDKEGFVWYEEYPSLENEPPHVLNGFIFALFGLYDYYKATESEEALELFNQGIKTLKEKINLWDMGFWSRYDLTDIYSENVYLFRFVTDERHPKFSHPIDKIVFHMMKDNIEVHQIVLDIGDKEDITDVFKNGSHLFYNQEYQDWGETYLLDGRSVRNYENCSGKWAHAPFQFLISCKPSCKYYLEITYKDITRESVYLEMYVEGVKYIRLDKLECINDGMWETVQVEVPSNLFILKEAATTNYHKLHIEQLNILYKITKEDIFNVYAQTFKKYYKSHSLKSIWQNIINEIKQKGRIG